MMVSPAVVRYGSRLSPMLRMPAARLARNFRATRRFYYTPTGRRVATGVARAAANTIARAWKKRKRSGRVFGGNNQNTRQYGNVEETGDPAYNIQTLYTSAIQFPSAGTAVGSRLGNTIFVNGIKLCERFHNTETFPIRLHYAIIQPKAPLSDGTMAVYEAEIKNEFFRDTTSSVRSKDFEDTTGVNPGYNFKYDCFPINPDKFRIIMHKRITLVKEVGLQTDRPTFTWSWEYFLRCRKKFTFRQANDIYPQQPLIRCWWYAPLNASDMPVSFPHAGLEHLAKQVVYFKNGLN